MEGKNALQILVNLVDIERGKVESDVKELYSKKKFFKIYKTKDQKE